MVQGQEQLDPSSQLSLLAPFLAYKGRGVASYKGP
jgi:hypothetical protein